MERACFRKSQQRTFHPRHAGGEGASPRHLGKSLLSRGNGQCKGPEASWMFREGQRGGPESGRGRGDEVWGIGRLPSWALAYCCPSCLYAPPVQSSETDCPGMAGALTTMSHTCQILYNVLTHRATVGPASHSFGYGDINPAPAVAVYSITDTNASSEQ